MNCSNKASSCEEILRAQIWMLQLSSATEENSRENFRTLRELYKSQASYISEKISSSDPCIREVTDTLERLIFRTPTLADQATIQKIHESALTALELLSSKSC